SAWRCRRWLGHALRPRIVIEAQPEHHRRSRQRIKLAAPARVFGAALWTHHICAERREVVIHRHGVAQPSGLRNPARDGGAELAVVAGAARAEERSLDLFAGAAW